MEKQCDFLPMGTFLADRKAYSQSRLYATVTVGSRWSFDFCS